MIGVIDYIEVEVNCQCGASNASRLEGGKGGMSDSAVVKGVNGFLARWLKWHGGPDCGPASKEEADAVRKLKSEQSWTNFKKRFGEQA